MIPDIIHSDEDIDAFMLMLIRQYLKYAEGCDLSLDDPFNDRRTFEEWKTEYEPFSSIIVQNVDELLKDLKTRKEQELDRLHSELVQKFKG